MAALNTIFQASDLNQRGRAILDAARAGQARLRDKDGLSLIIMPEQRMEALMAVTRAAVNLVALEQALANASHLTARDFGDWTWLRSLDEDDLKEFVSDMREALIVAGREEAPDSVSGTLQDWRTTAQALADPLRRDVLLGPWHDEDFVAVERPE